MKYQPGLLDSFISPITGKLRSPSLIPLEQDYILEGDKTGFAVPSLRLWDLRLDVINIKKNLSTTGFIIEKPMRYLSKAQALNKLSDGILKHKKGIVSIAVPGTDYFDLTLPFGNVLVGSITNKAVAQPTILMSNLPNLSSTKLWLGNENNRPVESQIIQLENLPNLGTDFLTGKGLIWRGTPSGRPEESNDLGLLEISNSLAHAGFAADIAAINADIFLINGGLAALGGSVAALQSEVIILANEIGNVNTRIDNLRLNTILADGDVSFYGFRGINFADPLAPTDAVNLRTLENRIDNINITLEGFVEGGPAVNGVIETVRGPTCLLTNIPAGGDVSMDNFRIKNLKQSPEENFDAISAQFLWDLLHDEVGVIWQ
jgi:hypothetical protein